MYQVFDLETTTKTTHKRKANAFDRDNWVVARGWKVQGDAQCSWTYHPEHDRNTRLVIPDNVDVLVGFNIKFDLTWEMVQGNYSHLREFYKRGGKIWDCQYAEYLLEGMIDSVQMCSLDSIIENYGGRKKIDQVKILWEQGVNTQDIPEDLLIDYLVGTEEENRNSGDIGNTELIYLGQRKRAEEMGMLKMIEDRMDGLLATTDMEYNGLKVDVKEAGRRLGILNASLAETTAALEEYIPKGLPFTFSWGSRVHVSSLIFGGTVKYKVRTTYIDDATGELARSKATEEWPVFQGKAISPTHPAVELQENGLYLVAGKVWQDRFVSGAKKGAGKYKKVSVPGELKIKWQDFTHKIEGVTTPNPEWETKTLDGAGKPIYSTAGDIIEELATRDIPFLKLMGKKQALDKEIGTYYVRYDAKKKENVGMLVCVQPQDHMLHHSLNHVNTVTSRLSSNNPNMQNIPTNEKSEVKKMFISRFGADGLMLELDYSQLEVVVQGVLSEDEQLIADLVARIDFHCKRVSAKFGCTYEEALYWCKDEAYEEHKLWKGRRRGVKEFSFQRAYGAGAAAIAASTGMPIEDVKQLIEQEDIMYPGVTRFNAAVETEVVNSAVLFQAVGDDGQWKNYRRGTYIAPTGTRYRFRSYDAPSFLQKRGIKDSFSPPDLKNYPIQGTGGEFVQAILGLLFRWFVKMDNYGGKAFLVNTVHDCVWVDSHSSVSATVAKHVKMIMESIPAFYNRRHDINIRVPLPVFSQWWLNMDDLKHVGA